MNEETTKQKENQKIKIDGSTQSGENYSCITKMLNGLLITLRNGYSLNRKVKHALKARKKKYIQKEKVIRCLSNLILPLKNVSSIAAHSSRFILGGEHFLIPLDNAHTSHCEFLQYHTWSFLRVAAFLLAL